MLTSQQQKAKQRTTLPTPLCHYLVFRAILRHFFSLRYWHTECITGMMQWWIQCHLFSFFAQCHSSLPARIIIIITKVVHKVHKVLTTEKIHIKQCQYEQFYFTRPPCSAMKLKPVTPTYSAGRT